MRSKLKKLSLMSALLAAFALTLTPVSAFAAPRPATASAAAPQISSCPAGWHFDDLTQKRVQFVATSNLLAKTNTNTTPFIPITWTAGAAKTVGTTVSKSSGGSLNIFILSIDGSINKAATTSITTSVTSSITLDVHPGQTDYAQYGVGRLVVVGHHYYVTSTCQINPDDGYVTVYAPYAQTWKNWCVNPSTCYSGGK